MKLFPIFVLSAITFATSAMAQVNTNPLTFSYDQYAPSSYSKKVEVINWNSEEGIKRLERSKFKADFFRLAHHVRSQEEPSTCAIATAVTVTRAIYELQDKKMPLVKSIPINFNGTTVGLEYRTIDEKTFYNEATDKIVDRRAIVMQYPKDAKTGAFMGGVDMEELAKMLKVHGVKAKVTHVATSTNENVDSFRKIVKEVVNDKERFLIANYFRGYQGIEMGGHFSPIAAYDEASDSILILDIAGHKNPWIWVSIADFHKSMNSKNYAGTEFRGYMVLR